MLPNTNDWDVSRPSMFLYLESHCMYKADVSVKHDLPGALRSFCVAPVTTAPGLKFLGGAGDGTHKTKYDQILFVID